MIAVMVSNLAVSAEQRTPLKGWMRAPSMPQGVARHAKVILLARKAHRQ
jgi:hypothetical protein